MNHAMRFRVHGMEIPEEIADFIFDCFEICEIRGRVGTNNGVIFHIRTNEGKHNIPHVHAAYGSHWVSIAISDARVLAGNLPHKQQSKAIYWVRDNREKLMEEWRTIVISGKLEMTKSILDF